MVYEKKLLSKRAVLNIDWRRNLRCAGKRYMKYGFMMIQNVKHLQKLRINLFELNERFHKKTKLEITKNEKKKKETRQRKKKCRDNLLNFMVLTEL